MAKVKINKQKRIIWSNNDYDEWRKAMQGEITDEGEQTITARGFEWKAVQGGTVATINATGTTILTASLTGLTAATEYT